ncbi:TonB-dependent receptor [Marinilabilia salmonicolor]|uniref:TonB-linked SusC/RagA family outer membrane protein n=1 Tax=Marinilabilia salmonicolor TaxID=989 RepID=A0A368V4J7_9BACT|nr:TonB-dependent receptor [Marinilabilia salmonicolor]RCW33931.1 TonB-linked SusC/RagA family outer membrane protein [Marinilabilia salmonicolor]
MRKTLGILFLMMWTTLLFAQDVTVTGKVTSAEDGGPIPGVSVVQKGTTNGTITDVDGNYSLTLPEGETIVFSFIGMETVEVIADQTTINVTMNEMLTDLDEVVVVGYGVQKKSVVTAAISSVSSEDLESSKPSRIEDVLKGKVSGVQITQSSGQPGSDSKVRIRGVGTINNSDPLYIVDGMAVGGGINYLNPTDIESVEVLKDAASAAVYGARAANGVILVTTKSGKAGDAKINYDFSYGWQNPWKKKSVLNAKEYMVIMNESLLNDGNAPRYTQDEIANAGEGTDWQDETFYYDAPVQNHQVSISGGNDNSTYFVSFGYFSQDGIVGGNYGRSNYDRYSVRANNTYNVFNADRLFLNNLKVGVNAGYSRIVSSGIETNSEYGSVLGSAITFNPLVPVYATDPDQVLADHPTAVTDSEGRVYSVPPSGFQEIANPVAMLDAPTGSEDNSDKIVSSFWAELDVVEGLKFKSSYGVDLAFWGGDGYEFEHFLATQGKELTRSHVYSNMHRGFTWQVENTLTYSKSLNDRHNFTVLLGQSAQEYTLRELYGDDYDLLENNPDKAVINYAVADRDDERVAGGTGGFSVESLASYFGRIDYNFDEKYMIQGTVRRDGSSRFGSENKWAIFPSVSLGWNVTNEGFLDGRPEWFDYLKLRASWGQNGNERIGNFAYTSLMDGNQNYYFGSGDNSTMQYGASPARIANPDLIWEESEQIDIGFDARFFNSAIVFGFDYFKKTTNGMLMDQPIPAYVGKGAPLANAGDMENSGLEFELNHKGNFGEFNYNVGINASYLQNKLIDMGNESGEQIYEDAGATGVGAYVKGENGEVFPYFYGYKVDGIIQNAEEAAAYNSTYGQNAQPGDVRFMDISGADDGGPDGKIDDADRTKIGKGMPDWTFGLNINADWRNFDLSMFFQGAYGNDIFDYSVRGDVPAMNRPSWILDRWTGEGTSNWLPRMTRENPNSNWRSSELYIKDGSYIRLKNIQLGYSLPTQILQSLAIERLRFFVSAENLLTLTDYDGFDPEIASGGYTTIGVDRGIYPQARTISVGANITF